jgi:hypothetical protein
LLHKLLQRLAEHVVEEPDAVALVALEQAHVVLREAQAADERELHVGVDTAERLAQVVHALLGHEPAHEQHVLPGLEPERGELPRRSRLAA